MRTKAVIKKPLLINKPLPMLLISALLSSSLFASGCSNSDTSDSSADTEDAATMSATNETAATNATSKDSDNGNIDGDNALNDIATLENEKIDTTTISSDTINPLTTNEQPSLVTNRTETGTPEDTVKQALNTLYYGDVKKAATYYKVDITNFEEELANTQYAFQQTVESVTIFDTKYNADKTRATISGELMLKGQSEPAPLGYELQKINGEWKILG